MSRVDKVYAARCAAGWNYPARRRSVAQRAGGVRGAYARRPYGLPIRVSALARRAGTRAEWGYYYPAPYGTAPRIGWYRVPLDTQR